MNLELRGSPLGHLAQAALVAYLIAAVLWAAELVLRITAIVHAGVATVRSGSVPEWAPALAAWGGGLFLVGAAWAGR